MGEPRRYVVCETVVAITLHLRELEPGEDPYYNGHKRHALTLCGEQVGWDTRIPVGHERCSACIAARGETEKTNGWREDRPL